MLQTIVRRVLAKMDPRNQTLVSLSDFVAY
jgi:hypothetical protein